MIIVMNSTASQKDIDYVLARARSLGLNTYMSNNNGKKVINLLGDLQSIDIDIFQGLHGVDQVTPLAIPYRLASLEYKSEKTIVEIGDIRVGSNTVVLMAGPCAVESRSQLMKIAHAVKESGGHMLRGGAFKPRTSPYSFQGLGEEGLEILAEAREATGLYIVTEVMTPDQVPLVSQYADLFQIGTRNMQNYALLYEVGVSETPVLLKRGMMSTINELLMSAEYILSQGNQNIILCERGIRTFETLTRNTLDINAVPVLKELTHLPVIIDPSHATGKASLVSPISKAAIAVGSDGLLIEVHNDPKHAFSDGYQSLTLEEFQKLVREVSRVTDAVDRQINF